MAPGMVTALPVSFRRSLRLELRRIGLSSGSFCIAICFGTLLSTSTVLCRGPMVLGALREKQVNCLSPALSPGFHSLLPTDTRLREPK